MCDYSLHLVASRPAKVGDKLITTVFAKSITRGFAAVGELEVAVCLVPGTELAFEDDIQYDRAFSLFGKARVNHKVARFRQVNMNEPNVHHDALEFPDGLIVKVTRWSKARPPRCSNCRLPCSIRVASLRRRRAPVRSTPNTPTRGPPVRSCLPPRNVVQGTGAGWSRADKR
jgi:hypothetical protein